MDLDRFDTREKASAGVDFDLVIDGETQYGDDGKPITFKVKGLADPEVHALYLKQVSKSAARTPAEVERDDLALARVAVTGWSDNFTVRGEKYEYSRENVAKVLVSPPVRRYVVRRIAEEESFMNGA